MSVGYEYEDCNCHPWCSDPARDEAVRMAEDGRQGALPTLEEAIAAITQKGNDMATKAEIQAADYRAEATSERTEGVTERRPPDPRGRGNVTGHADTGANTGDRGWHRKQWDDAVGIICDGGSWGRGNSFDVAKIGALMIWADKEMRQTVGLRSMLAAATRELDALKDIIIASEAAPDASDAARTKPVAWAILRGGHFIAATVNKIAANESCKDNGGTVVPLYAAPQPAPGWLTAEERGLIEGMMESASAFPQTMHWHSGLSVRETLLVMESLLARSSPPEVVIPFVDPALARIVYGRDSEWLAALAAAGVTVKEVGRE